MTNGANCFFEAAFPAYPPIFGDLPGTFVDYLELPLGPSLVFDSSILKFFFSAYAFSPYMECICFVFASTSFFLSVRPTGDLGEDCPPLESFSLMLPA